jgi:hypothetical protein
MTEVLFLDTPTDPTNTFVINPEAYTARKLLTRRSSDEDNDDDDDQEDDDEEEEQQEEEEEGDDEEDNGDDTLVEELNNGHENHLTPPPKLPPSPSYPFFCSLGRGIRSLTLVIIFHRFPLKTNHLNFRLLQVQYLSLLDVVIFPFIANLDLKFHCLKKSMGMINI